MSNVRKALIAGAAGLGVAATALADEIITASEWVTIALAVLGAIGVYAVPNTPPGPPELGDE